MRLALLFLMLGPIALTIRAAETVPSTTLASSGIDGPWISATGDVLVSIAHTNDGHRLILRGIADAIDPDDGAPRNLDTNNPRRSLRDRSLPGLELGTLQRMGERYSGTLYDPEHGRTYRVLAELISEDVLRMRAYIGVPALGRTLYWQRLTAYERRLDALAQAAAQRQSEFTDGGAK